MDAYQTIDSKAVDILLPHLVGVSTFAEPCAGEGYLVRQLTAKGFSVVYQGDLADGQDALEANYSGADTIITNPPWTREILHAMILWFQSQKPTWLLFDADWAHTKQAAPYLDQCSHIVSVGRLKWIPDSKSCGKDNCAWYRFHNQHTGGPKFIGPVYEKGLAA